MKTYTTEELVPPGWTAFTGVGYINGGPTTCADRDNFVGGSGVTAHGQIATFGDVGPGGSLVWGTPGQTGPHSTGEEYGVGIGSGASLTYSNNWKRQ